MLTFELHIICRQYVLSKDTLSTKLCRRTFSRQTLRRKLIGRQHIWSNSFCRHNLVESFFVDMFRRHAVINSLLIMPDSDMYVVKEK